MIIISTQIEPERARTMFRYFFERLNAVLAVLANTAIFSQSVKKVLPQRAIFNLKIYRNAFCPGPLYRSL